MIPIYYNKGIYYEYKSLEIVAKTKIGLIKTTETPEIYMQYDDSKKIYMQNDDSKNVLTVEKSDKLWLLLYYLILKIFRILKFIFFLLF